MLSRHSVGTYRGNERTHNWSRNARSQSCQLAEPLWIDPGLKSGISMRELIHFEKPEWLIRFWLVCGLTFRGRFSESHVH